MLKNYVFLLLFFISFSLLTGCNTGPYLISNTTPYGMIRVQKGDTLYSLSRKNNVPLRAMIDANNLKPPYTLSIGQLLRLPQFQIHTVQKSETLYSISKRYGLSVSALAKQNNIKAPYTLSIGQKLRINPIANTSSNTTKLAQKTSSKTKTTSQKIDRKKEQQREANIRKKYASSTWVKQKNSSIPKNQQKKKFAWPVRGKIVSDFGNRGKGQHNDGINIACTAGTTVKAAESGVVAYAGDELKGYGNLLLIRHSGGWITAYAHNQTLLVKKGDTVKKGQAIAKVGKTGSVKTPQLHFEIRYKTKVVNPKSYLQ